MFELIPPAIFMILAAVLIGPARGRVRDAIVLGAPLLTLWFIWQVPDGVVFEHVPSSLNPRWTEHARAYYAFKMMDVLDKVHKALFDAIHVERKRVTSEDTIAEFVADLGIDEKLFREHYRSFPVETQVRRNIQKEKRYGHRGVPAVIVNGKYLVSASLAGSNQRMIDIMNFLVAKELAQ